MSSAGEIKTISRIVCGRVHFLLQVYKKFYHEVWNFFKFIDSKHGVGDHNMLCMIRNMIKTSAIDSYNYFQSSIPNFLTCMKGPFLATICPRERGF